ncbi:phage major capsid protein [Mycolicibacterium elephantis]|uniref:phage major capsid protein n=1 Tax=Mycolicibacterium elephantis TaxID=81858 RepID=UPI0009F620A8|nr:phage major capsid protein [Mycolicibacterium elephantis]
MTNHVTPTHWAMDADTFTAFRKIKVGDADARYVFDPSTVQTGTAFRVLGLPVIVTSHVPANTVALVDFSRVVVARDVDAEVKILDQTWGDYDSIGIRVVTRYDVALLQDEAVTLLTAGEGEGEGE